MLCEIVHVLEESIRTQREGQYGWTLKALSESRSVVSVFATLWYTIHGILQARILEWAAFPFSRGSSQPRDQTQVSCIAGGFFTN